MDSTDSQHKPRLHHVKIASYSWPCVHKLIRVWRFGTILSFAVIPLAYSCIPGAALMLTSSSVLVLRATVAKQRKVSTASTGSA